MELTTSELRVRICGGRNVIIGDMFMIEVFGLEKIVSFRASLAIVCEDDASFTVFAPLAHRPNPDGNARIAVSGFAGQVVLDGMPIDVEVQDISRQGVGLLSATALPIKKVVTMSFQTPVGEITCSGEIKYSREDPEAQGAYRTGVLLEELGRVEKARWKLLFELDAA